MSFLGLGKKKEKSLLEDEAFGVIMEILTLAKAGNPYRHLLAPLRDAAERYPRVAMLVKGLYENLQDGIPKHKR